MVKKINVKELRVGMYVANIKMSWLFTPFMKHSFLLTTQKQIKEIENLGVKDVFIDTEKGFDIGEFETREAERKERERLEAEKQKREEEERLKEEERLRLADDGKKPNDYFLSLVENEESEDEKFEEDAEGNPVLKPIPDKITFEKEVQASKEVRREMEHVVKDVMEDIKMGQAVNTESVAIVAKEMVDSIYRNKNAMASLARLKNFNEYTFNHSVNVAILASTFGRHIRMTKKEVLCLGIGGLLHDLGKMSVPESILNKPGSLTKEEFEIMKSHVTNTSAILDKSEGIPEPSYLFAVQHHERCDGNGYPNGLKETEISIYGKIAAIADVYDAITSDRVYHTARLPFDALRFLFTLSNSSLYKPYVETFIQCIGIYPIGSYVLLDTEEVAVVTSINKDALLRPNVRLMLNTRGYKVDSKILYDLNERKADKSFKRKIVRAVSENEYKLPPSSSLEFIQ